MCLITEGVEYPCVNACNIYYCRGFKLIKMSNREGETAVTIPLQYNEAVSNVLYTFIH